MNCEEKFYRIGEVSEISNISIKTLRYYDEIGLLKPKRIDTESGYRYYCADQLTLIVIIKYFKEAGFSLKEIKILLGREDMNYNQKKISEKCTEIDNKISDLIRLKEKLQFCLNETKQCENKQYDSEIKIEYIPVSYVAYLSDKGDCSQEEFAVRYCRLMSLIEKNKFHLIKNVMALYYDSCIDFEKEDKHDYNIEVCAVISEQKEIPGLVKKFGGFKAVTAYHYGNYSQLIELYRKMFKYIKENGFKVCGPAIDNYLVDIVSTSNENNYVTQLIVPIKDA